jgi:hypothetical protein
LSGFTINLNAGSDYYFVTTGFSNTDEGTFSNTFTGPGNIFLVPEPYTSLLFGLAIVGLTMTRWRLGRARR